MSELFTYRTAEEVAAESTHNDNPFGLVYSGAITENVPGKVNIIPISYMPDGLRLVANVYVPAGYDKDAEKKYAGVVVAHPNGGVKEQVAGLYAQRLAENGYVALAFDAAYQGHSGGEPRNTDKPAHRIEDIHRACDIIRVFPGVDPERVGVLGICGGGGYTIKAAQTDKRFKAVATLSMFNTGVVRRNGFLDSATATIQQRLREACEARELELSGKEVRYTANMCEMPESEADKLPYDLYRDGYYYYGKTHAHPCSSFAYTVSSNVDLMSFDAVQGAELIDAPLLMIAGKSADTLYMTEHVFAAAAGTGDKELYLVPGATHIQTYWAPEYVEQSRTSSSSSSAPSCKTHEKEPPAPQKRRGWFAYFQRRVFRYALVSSGMRRDSMDFCMALLCVQRLRRRFSMYGSAASGCLARAVAKYQATIMLT